MIIITLKDIIFLVLCGVGLLVAGALFIIGTIIENHKRK